MPEDRVCEQRPHQKGRTGLRRNSKSTPSSRTRRQRLWRQIVLWPCVIAVVAVAAGFPVYVRPQIDPLRSADAIFILGGADYRRYPFGMGLGAEGWAPTVVVSNPNGSRDPWLTGVCATPHEDFDLECFLPDPRTTKGEGRELRRLAAERGWQTVIVVTFRPHVSRARHILQQCFDGQLIMVASPDRLSLGQWVREYAYQTVGFVRSLFQPGC